MDLKEYLTSEKVCKKFQSQFDLVNYAIGLAANMISTGRDCRVKTESQSRAIQVLNEILNDKDYLDEIVPEVAHETIRENILVKPLSKKEEPEVLKPSERKKMRRVSVD
jgi:DNA-directed RNA polymerase subunit omega